MSGNGNNRSRAARASASMRTGKNGNTSSGNSTKRTNTSSGTNQSRTSSGNKDNDLGGKIALVVFVIVLLALFLCNFGLISVVGDAVSGFLFGVFGLLAYITPICIGVVFFCYKFSKNKRESLKIIISSICLYFLIAVICDMVSKTGISMNEYSFAELYKLGRDGRCGGGLVSGSLAYLVKSFLGTAGLVILLILGIFICLLVISKGHLWTFITGLFFNFSEDREARMAQKEERRAKQLEQRQLKQLESGVNRGSLIEDKSHNDSDVNLIRNKEHLPLTDLSDNTVTGNRVNISPDTNVTNAAGTYTSGTDNAGTDTAGSTSKIDSGRSDYVMTDSSKNGLDKAEANKTDSSVSSSGEFIQRPSLREKFMNTVTARNEKAKLQHAENKRLRDEARENNEILKIALPQDNRAVPTQYKSSEEMHEVFVDVQGDLINENELLSNEAELPASEDMDKKFQKTDNNVSGTGYPEGYRSGKIISHEGISSSAVRGPLEKISIPKQNIRSEHSVNITEDFEPIDVRHNLPYNADNDLDKFDDFTNEGTGAADKHINNNVAVSDSSSSEADYDSKITENKNIDDSVKYSETEQNSDLGKGSDSDFRAGDNSVSNKNSRVIDENNSESKDGNNSESKDGNNSESKDGKDSETDKLNAYSARKYKFPPITLLKPGKNGIKADERQLADTAVRLEETLNSFGVKVQVTDYVQGPSVTRFEMTLEPGTKVSKILSLADDIKLSLASADVRIEAPIPGKSAVGIEVPNAENSAVALRTLLESNNFRNSSSTLSFAVGMNIGGEVIVSDIAKMPHVLIAGATGSGKSVCINTLIMSIIYKATPEEVQMILIDPKVVELSVYNGIPHLAIPVVTDPQKASAALNWAVEEMDRRYKLFADLVVRDLKGYNEKIDSSPELSPKYSKLPKIVIIIDELADLMMTCGKEVEASICRLAQLARACGIHLVVATQRPSVDVITGLIKANMPSRMAFAVSSGVDSRTILDTVGAEKLLGKGDMLFYPQGKAKPERVQGAFVSDEEVGDVVQFLLAQKLGNPFAETTNINLETNNRDDDEVRTGNSTGNSSVGDNDRDEFYAEAGRLIINTGKASMGFLQRKFKIGFNRAARIMDNLAEDGVVGEESGTKAREILMTIEQFESFLDDNGIK